MDDASSTNGLASEGAGTFGTPSEVRLTTGGAFLSALRTWVRLDGLAIPRGVGIGLGLGGATVAFGAGRGRGDGITIFAGGTDVAAGWRPEGATIEDEEVELKKKKGWGQHNCGSGGRTQLLTRSLRHSSC